MRDRRAGRGTAKSLAALGLALAVLGLALASGREEAQGQAASGTKGKKTKPGRTRTRKQDPPGVPIPDKGEPKKAEDPLAKPAQDQAKGGAAGKFHYTLKVRSFDEATLLAASYYPPNPAGSSSPVVLLIHDFGRSRRDFEDPIGELKGEGLAEHLQGLGFAVLSLDLRGQGQNARRALSANDRELMAQDIQAAYQFLVDRHNRGELNLSKFGVLGVGEGANLVAAWAFQPGAAMTIDERPSDLNAMVLVSPNPAGHGYRLGQLLDTLGSRFPILILAGEKDKASSEAAKAAAAPLGRSRLNKIELFPSALHGYTLLRLEPRVTGGIIRFLETTLKDRAAEYEPRYNLNPIAYSDIRTHKNSSRADGDKPKEPAKAKGQ
jgi:alpha-beta hydrolase superfamily lysophospholipase